MDKYDKITDKIVPIMVVSVFLTIGGCTVACLGHPGGLNHKGETPEFFIAFLIIAGIIACGSIAVSILQAKSLRLYERKMRERDPLSDDFKPQNEAERLEGLAAKRSKKVSERVYGAYLDRLRWTKITGYRKYLYRHYIECDWLRGLSEKADNVAKNSVTLSMARTDTSDPFVAGGIADGLFGPAAGVAAYTQTVSKNARNEVLAEQSRQNYRDMSTSFFMIGSEAKTSLSVVERAIREFKSDHFIRSGMAHPEISFSPVHTARWDADIRHGMIRVAFRAEVKGRPIDWLGEGKSRYDGAFIVTAKLGGSEVGKGFLLGGCREDGTGSLSVSDNPEDPDSIIRICQSNLHSNYGFHVRAANSAPPDLKGAGFEDGIVYDAHIMLEDGTSRDFKFEDLTFDVSPATVWAIGVSREEESDARTSRTQQKQTAKTQKQAERRKGTKPQSNRTEQDRTVWVLKGNKTYHGDADCQYIRNKGASSMKLSDAIANGCKACGRCGR